MNPGRRLFAAFACREFATPQAALRVVTVATAACVCGYLAAGTVSGGGARPGALARTLADYEQLAGFLVGLAAGLRLTAHVHEDQRDGWLAQLFALGVRRDAYLAQLAAAVLLAAAADYLLALVGFLAVHAAAAGTAPVARLARGAAPALPWFLAVTALAAACSAALVERTRARFAFGALVLAPYPLAFLAGFLNDDRAPTLLVRIVGTVAPLWPSPTVRGAAWLLLYAGAALCLALLLAPVRIARSA